MLQIIAGKLSKAFLDIFNHQLAKYFNEYFILLVIFFPALLPPATLPFIPTDLKIILIINPIILIINPNPKLIAVIVNPNF